MPRPKLTEAQKQFINDNYTKMSRKDMGKQIEAGYTMISTYMKKKGLSVSKKQSRMFAINKRSGRTNFTAKEDLFIKTHYLTMPVKIIANNLGRSGTGVRGRLKALKLIIPKDVIENRKINSRFSKGHSPSTKGKKQTDFMTNDAIERTKATRFKKGRIPANAYKKDGVISIRTDKRTNRRYKYIRISIGVWKELHVYNWTNKKGNVPEGHCLWFIDGDTMNCELENLELITKKENIYRNAHQYSPEIRYLMRLKNKLNKAITKNT